MTNVKKVVLTMIVIALLCLCISNVFATDDFQIIGGNEASQNAANNVTNNTANTNTSGNIIAGGNNTSTYNNVTTTLPQTGAGDYMMILIIGVLGVSAVYAYKKIRDYKNV